MPILFPLDKLRSCHELVICDSYNSRQAHKELFHFSDEIYIVSGDTDNVFDLISEAVDTLNSSTETCPSKIHIVLAWENILRVSSWKSDRPSAGDALIVLGKSGVSRRDLEPFKTADISDLLPWLYYGKQFDVLRKICHAAKRQLESHLSNHAIIVVCHLISDDGKRIIASSL